MRDATGDAVTDARVTIKIELWCEARKAARFNSTADGGEETWQMKSLLGHALKARGWQGRLAWVVFVSS